MKKIQLLLLCCCWAVLSFGQETFPRNDVQDTRMGAYAFTNATIVVDENQSIPKGTLLIKEGKIQSVGANVTIPQGYTTVDLTGKFIYPSLIDLQTHYGMPEVKRPSGNRFRGPEQINSKKKGAYNSNEAIKSEFKSSEHFTIDKKMAKEMRNLGFGTVLTYRPDGFARGTGAVVTLAESTENKVMLNNLASAHYSFNKGSSGQSYPVSRMGHIALLKQTYLDAEWFSKQRTRPFTDQSLEAFIDCQKLPQFFEAGNWLDVLRADKLGDEVNVQYIISSQTDAYQRVKDIKASGATLIVPVNFPDAHDVEDPFDAERVSYKDMLHWELAPTNTAVLAKNGVPFALTADGLKKKSSFLTNVRKAIENGLTEKAALKALTTTPANLLGLSNQIGSLRNGHLANFLITNGKLFDKKTVIHENWIQGQPYRMSPLSTKDFGGNYTLTIDGKTYQMEVSGAAKSPKAKIIVNDSTDISVKSTFSDELISLSFPPEKGGKEKIRLSGWTSDSGWKGQGQLVDGSWVNWSATPSEASKKSEDKKDGKKGGKKGEKAALGKVMYPFRAFGVTEMPEQKNYLIKNATV